MQVLCDTSFLMVLVSKPIKQVPKVESALGRLDFIVPDIVLEELERLAQKSGPKRATLAKTAIELTQAKFKQVKVGRASHVDDAIVELDEADLEKVAGGGDAVTAVSGRPPGVARN